MKPPSLFAWLSPTLTSLLLRNMKTHACNHTPRHTQTEGFELNNLSHISTKTHCCITLLPQPKHYVQHSYFVWRHFFFLFCLSFTLVLALLHSVVGTQECVWCRKTTYTLCEAAQLQILVSQSVLSNMEGS